MRVYEIFTSINGEVCALGQGSFTTFIRLAGCNLKCSYCDTPETQDVHSGEDMDEDQIIMEVIKHGINNITITGGEPMLQQVDLEHLCRRLWHKGYRISVETNGSYNPLFGYVESWIVDYKLPSSGMMGKMDPSVHSKLGPNDWVKFVIGDEKDLLTAIEITEFYIGLSRAKFAFSPVNKQFPASAIIKKLNDYKIPQKYPSHVFLNIQIHKIIGVK